MPDERPDPSGRPRVRIFESYGRQDASDLATRLRDDLSQREFDVFQDIEQIHAGADWELKLREALKRSEVVVAILSPHATRSERDTPSASLCLAEIGFALNLPRPIVPVMAIDCEPPLTIYRLRCVDMQGWQEADVYEAALEELVEAIELACAGTPRLRPLVGSLNADQQLGEIMDHGAFLEKKREQFTGRRWILAEIEQWRTAPGERALVITADLGAGKSALVAELVHHNPGGQVVAYHCCVTKQPYTLSPGKFVTNLAAMLSARLPAYADAIARGGLLERLTDAERDPSEAFALGVIEPLQRLDPPDGPARYILIDGLDETLGPGSPQESVTILDLVAAAAELFPPWLRVVATSQRRRVVLQRLPGARELALDAHDPRNLADVRDYLATRLRDPTLAPLIASSGRDYEQFLELVSALADGSFLYAQNVVDALRNENLKLHDLERLPPGVSELYETSFRRTFATADEYAPSAAMLAVLLAARRDLRRDQLQTILQIPAVELERRRAALEPYMNRIEGAFSVFHKSLADWLTLPDSGTTEFHVERADGERLLIDWCRRWRELDDDYPLRYLPAHLANTRATEELLALLRDDEFARRRRAANVSPLLEIDDHAQLSSLLLADGRVDQLSELAQTTSPYQRDGVALALRAASDAHDPAVRSAVGRLLLVGSGHGGDELSAELLSARTIAIEVAAYRGYREALLTAADDRSAAVRAIVVPYLYHYWRQHGEDGWTLVSALGEQLIGRFGLPRQSQVEVSGGLSLAILTRDFEDEVTLARLKAFWQLTVHTIFGSPVLRVAGRRMALKATIAALSVVMRSQPEYQPFNLNELRRTFAGPADHGLALAALVALEHPEQGCGPVLEVLERRELEFDVFLMLVAERALVLQGSRDPGTAIAAIERLFHSGAPWFRQSCLYAGFHTLYTATAPDDAWLEIYGALTREFVERDGARLQTAVGSYSFPPHLAWAELVFARHRRTGRSEFLAAWFRSAAERGDQALCRTVTTACHLLSLAYREPQLALDALREIVALVADEDPLRSAIVDALANIRLYEDASVDRFLLSLNDPELTERVAAAAPSVRADEFPTWMDSFFNHELVSSDEFRLQVCRAFNRAATVDNVRELLYDNVVWVLNMLAGEELIAQRS